MPILICIQIKAFSPNPTTNFKTTNLEFSHFFYKLLPISVWVYMIENRVTLKALFLKPTPKDEKMHLWVNRVVVNSTLFGCHTAASQQQMALNFKLALSN